MADDAPRQVFDKIKPVLPELADLQRAKVVPPPAAEIEDGKVVIKRRPDRPHHLCLTCEHYHEVAFQKRQHRPDKRIFLDFASWCLVNPEISLRDQTVLDCRKYANTGENCE